MTANLTRSLSWIIWFVVDYYQVGLNSDHEYGSEYHSGTTDLQTKCPQEK